MHPHAVRHLERRADLRVEGVLELARTGAHAPLDARVDVAVPGETLDVVRDVRRLVRHRESGEAVEHRARPRVPAARRLDEEDRGDDARRDAVGPLGGSERSGVLVAAPPRSGDGRRTEERAVEPPGLLPAHRELDARERLHPRVAEDGGHARARNAVGHQTVDQVLPPPFVVAGDGDRDGCEERQDDEGAGAGHARQGKRRAIEITASKRATGMRRVSPAPHMTPSQGARCVSRARGR